jgi:hypothetical protein
MLTYAAKEAHILRGLCADMMMIQSIPLTANNQ